MKKRIFLLTRHQWIMMISFLYIMILTSACLEESDIPVGTDTMSVKSPTLESTITLTEVPTSTPEPTQTKTQTRIGQATTRRLNNFVSHPLYSSRYRDNRSFST